MRLSEAVFSACRAIGYRCHSIMTEGSPVPTVVEDVPALFTPMHLLPTRAAGRPPIRTVTLPSMIDPVHAVPEIRSPWIDAGLPPMMTVGIPGPVMVSPVIVVSPIRAAGVLIECVQRKSAG